MKSIYFKIWFLIGIVAFILFANTFLNKQIIRQNESIYNKKNVINLVLRHLVDLSYLTIVIDNLQENIQEKDEQLKHQYISLKNQEFDLIKENHLLLQNNGLIDSSIIRSLALLEKNEIVFKNYISSKKIIEWIKTNSHESIHLSNAIKKIEEHLYSNRMILMAQSESNLQIINYIDIFQAISIIIITLIIVRMLLKENKRQNELIAELKLLNATKDKFFSIISHDLRSPFNAILGFAEVLQKEFHTYSQEQTHQYLTYINQAARKTFELLENLLEWSSLQTGKNVPRFKSIQINELINEEIDLFKSMANHKYIEIKTDLSSNSQVLVDKNMMNTVFRNLISNAIKFTDVNGLIEIKTFEDTNDVIISISDSGVGIDNSTIDNLFKMDTKISTIGTQGEKGTGLGLLLCKELVEKNSGKIFALSEISVGTTFQIRLPKD
jgi:signal transduction histidine kinase